MSTPEAEAGGLVADTVDDLTPEWLTAALRASGHDLTVATARATRVGTGQIGATYRLELTFAGDAPGPSRLVAKLAAEDRAGRAMVADGYRKEVGFYRHLAATLAVRTPRCWHSGISVDGTAFTLLLDDLAPARPGVQAEACTVEQARVALANVAGLHAPRWGDPSLRLHGFLPEVDATAAAFLGQLHQGATEQFVRRYAGVLADDDVATLRESAERTAAWLSAGDAPATLVHGDYRLDNLMFHPDGTTVHALDWQTVSLGPAARDVAYFAGTCLLPADRRLHERALVEAYHRELVRLGVEGYDAGRCWHDYRLGQLQAPLITVLGCEYATAVRTPQADEMFLAMARRSCQAIRELDSLALVDSLT